MIENYYGDGYTEQDFIRDEKENERGHFFFMEQVQERETKWLWYPYIPYGKITIIQGDPGQGKSTLVLNLIASVTRGMQFPEKQMAFCPKIAVYQNAEDGLEDTVKPRLRAAGADCGLIAVLDERNCPLSLIDKRLDLILEQTGAEVLVLDPLQAYLGDHVDMHRANEIRPLMHALADLAARHNCAVILIGHMNKASGLKSIYRGLGSIDITAAARSVLTVASDPKHPENRVILQVKNSLAKMGDPVAFTLDEDGKFQYLGEYEVNTENLLSAEPVRVSSQIEKAEKLILEWIEKEHPLYAKDIYDIADSEDITKRTLCRARARLGIQVEKTEKGYIWTAGSGQCPPPLI